MRKLCLLGGIGNLASRSALNNAKRTSFQKTAKRNFASPMQLTRTFSNPHSAVDSLATSVKSVEGAVNDILYGFPQQKNEATQRHILSVLVDNESGVLSKISGLLSARGERNVFVIFWCLLFFFVA